MHPTRQSTTHWQMALAIAAVLALSSSSAAFGQELVTDRPDATESSVTVPAGHWQVEAGWTLSRDDDGGTRVETKELPGTLVRLGLSQSWELRIGWSGWVSQETSFGGATREVDGAGDGELGAKVFLREERGAAPEIALLFGTSLPVGDDGLTTDRFDPAFRLSLSHTLSDRLSLGYNLGMEWETGDEDGERDTLSRGIYTVALGIGLDERAGAFVELFGDVPASDPGDPAHSLAGGFTWLLTDTLQLDLAGGVGLSDEADDWFAGLGVSFRAPF